MFDKEKLAWNGVSIGEIDLFSMTEESRGEMFGAIGDEEVLSDLASRWRIEQIRKYGMHMSCGAYAGDENPLSFWLEPDELHSVMPSRFLEFNIGDEIHWLCELLADAPDDTEWHQVHIGRATRMRDALMAQVEKLNAAMRSSA